ncbi:ATP-binding protein [Humidesulfovibrio sp.]
MRNAFFSSLRNSLITLVFLAVLPALGVILHASLENRTQAIRAAEAEALRVAQFLAREQQLITLRAEQLLTLLAQMPQVQAQDAAGTTAILRRLKHRNSVFSNIIALDSHGRVFASATTHGLPFWNSDGRSFAAAMESGEFTVGEYELGLRGGAQIQQIQQIQYTYPITGADGQITGVLSTALHPDRYEHVFNVASLPKGSVLSIADLNGTRLYRYPMADDTSPTGRKLVMELWDVISGPQDMGTTTVAQADGVRRIVAYVQLRLRPEDRPYLYISVGIPEKQALAGAIDTLRRDLLLLAGAALLAILVAWGVGGIVISRPVERLTGVARRLGGGELDARSGDPESFGELALLAKTLDNMADALSDDIAAREAVEVELRKSEALLRMILEALPVGVWMSDPQGRILYANHASQSLWGAYGDGLPDLETDFLAWRHGTGEPLRYDDFILAQAIAGVKPLPASQVLEIEAPHATGRLAVKCSAIRICGEDDALRAVIVVLEDITERTQREQARESVEHILRHDLRSPLIGFASLPQLLLRQPNLTEEQRDWVTRLQASAHGMLRIIDAYLKLSRIERGNLALEPVEADLLRLAHEVCTSMALLPQCSGKHVLLTLNGMSPSAGQTLLCSCEPTLVATMLSNLIKNALEASPEGGIVEVDLADLGEAVSFSVRNDGEVPRVIRNRFFEKYVTAGKPGGTGLGAYSARRIAEFHGGSAGLDCSEPGKTLVSVLLPKTQPGEAA